MDLQFITEYAVPVIVGLCLCVGFVIKQSLSFIPNQYIPLLMAVLGLFINIGIHGGISAEIALGGMFSGLASTGLHQMFQRMLERGDGQ